MDGRGRGMRDSGLAGCRHTDTFAHDDFKQELADRNPIAGFEDDLSLYSRVVDECAVGTPQVAQADGEIIDGEDTMMAADKIAVWSEMTILFAADQKLAHVEGDCLTLLPPFKNLQFHLNHSDGAPTNLVCTGPRRTAGH